MDKNKQIILVSIVAFAIIVVCSLGMSMKSDSDEEEYKQRWKERAESALNSKGYNNIRILSSTPFTNDNSATIFGSFTSNGSKYSFTVDYVWENGSWKLYDVNVF